VNNASALDGWGVMRHAVELERRGEEFALATAVWREAPSSGQHGSRAIVTRDGDVIGWIGGACAEPVLIREAQKVLAEGQPKLLALGTSEQFGEVPQGMTAIAISCQSEGALQIFIEPVIPVVHLIIVGRSPMAHTLCELAQVLGWNTELVDGPEFSAEAIGPRSIVVVATQGHGDEDVLEMALAASPVYLGVVGSVQRGEALRGYLADRGFAADALAAIRIPVGLDLGATSHREVAVAVLAELVELRAAGRLRLEPSVSSTATSEAVDPVCGMTVAADNTSRPLTTDGETYYFCGAGCRAKFERQVGSELAGDAT
jgi:xanthine dehydrogenase accessory factor